MALAPAQEKRLLIVLLVTLVVLVIYRISTYEDRKTVPLTYQPGAKAALPVRSGIASQREKDLVSVLIGRKGERFPGVSRDIFRMENPSPPKPKEPPKPAELPPPPPPPPEKTPEEIAAEVARADLLKFRFLGYLTEKDSSLFLSKDGELYIVKSGDTVLKNYKVKEAGRDYVILLDTVTNVEVRVELTGGPEQAPGRRFR